MSAAAPAKCTGMINRVRPLRHRSIDRAFTISVSRSTSANTGRAPASTTRFGVETHVSEGVITSSPSPTPSARSRTCSPAVAEFTATAPATPDMLGETAFELDGLLAGRDPAGAQDFRDGRDVILRDGRTREGQELGLLRHVHALRFG